MEKRDLRRIDAIRAGWADLSPEEVDAFKAVLNTSARPDLVLDLLVARSRCLRRQDSDRRTDASRRILVGARVPRAFYDRVKECAELSGLSLYRFAVNALAKECIEVARMRDVEKTVEN